jgi:hypothetical protein
MDRGLLRRCIRFADDRNCPQAAYFLEILYLWVDGLAQGIDFPVTRGLYDDWLDVARGINDSAVKRWRHHARRIFQGLEKFDREDWWRMAQTDKFDGR